jgi:hypothetical protein
VTSATLDPPQASGEDAAPRRRPARPPTPTLLWLSGVLVVVLLAVTCLAGATAALSRDAVDDEISARLEPLNADSATLYRALADADAAVITGALARGQAPAAGRRYDDDINAAAGALAAAAARADDPATADRVAFLTTQLPVYTGLVVAARAADAAGAPAGTTYLGEASALLQNSMLPVAASLQQRQARQLSDAFATAAAPPVTAIVAAVLTLAALVVVQVAVARRVHRVLNPGLLAATVLLLLTVVWWAVAGTAADRRLAIAEGSGRAVSEALVPAQIAALRARATEAAALVRGTTVADDPTFTDRMELLARDGGEGGALGAARRLATDPGAQAHIADAVTAASAYADAHTQIVAAAAAGRDDEAVRLAVTRPDATSTGFGQLDADLVAAVDDERGAFTDRMAQVQAWRTGLAGGSIALAALAVLAVGAGLWRRLDDYRNPARGLPDPTAKGSS